MSSAERRVNQRYPLRAFATLSCLSNDESAIEWAVHLLDISATGARLALLDEHNLAKGDTIELRVELPQSPDSTSDLQFIHLAGIVVHRQDHIVGVEYEPKSPVDSEDLRQLLATIA